MARNERRTLPDLGGRRVLVTGASDGIGLEIAARFAGAGAEVVVPVRNRDKGAAAVARITAQHPDASVLLEDLDLSSLESVSTLGERLRSGGTPIDVFVGNAGVMNPPERQTTRDGFELQFGTNHLGHVALVGALLPLLRAADGRVVMQSSVAAQRASIRWVGDHECGQPPGCRSDEPARRAPGDRTLGRHRGRPADPLAVGARAPRRDTGLGGGAGPARGDRHGPRRVLRRSDRTRAARRTGRPSEALGAVAPR